MMNSKIPVVRKRRRSGHVIAEMGIAFFPYFAIIFGIADVSMAIFINGLFQSATREGCRFAITYNLTYKGTTYTSQTAVIRAVVEDSSIGFLNTTNGPTYIQVNYYFPDALSTPATTAQLPHNVQDSNGNTISVVSSLNQTGNVIEVRVQSFPWNWMVPLPHFTAGTVLPSGHLGLSMSESSLDVLQGLPIGTTTYPTY